MNSTSQILKQKQNPNLFLSHLTPTSVRSQVSAVGGTPRQMVRVGRFAHVSCAPFSIRSTGCAVCMCRMHAHVSHLSRFLPSPILFIVPHSAHSRHALCGLGFQSFKRRK